MSENLKTIIRWTIIFGIGFFVGRDLTKDPVDPKAHYNQGYEDGWEDCAKLAQIREDIL